MHEREYVHFYSCFPLFFLLCKLLFCLLIQLVFQSAMTTPLYSSTPAPSNPLLDLNLNMNVNPETMVPDNMFNLKYRQTNSLYEALLFEPIKQIRVSHAMFKVAICIILGYI